MSRGIGVRFALGAVLLFGLSKPASATLVGDEVRIQISSVDTTFIVANGATADFSVSSFNWNVEDSSIFFFIGSVTNATLAPNVSWTLSDLDWVGEPLGILTGASIDSATGLFTGATNSILTVDDHSLVVDLSSFAGLSLEGSPSMLISLQKQVPEPGTLGLLGAALAGLGVLGRRRRSQR